MDTTVSKLDVVLDITDTFVDMETEAPGDETSSALVTVLRTIDISGDTEVAVNETISELNSVLNNTDDPSLREIKKLEDERIPDVVLAGSVQ